MDFLANRYGTSPFEVLDWYLPDAVAMYYAAVRNNVRERIYTMMDRLATNEISMEIKHYDKHGKEIKGEGKVDPVGFKEHIESLQRLIGIEQRKPRTREDRMREAARKAEEFFTKVFAKGGG